MLSKKIEVKIQVPNIFELTTSTVRFALGSCLMQLYFLSSLKKKKFSIHIFEIGKNWRYDIHKICEIFESIGYTVRKIKSLWRGPSVKFYPCEI